MYVMRSCLINTVKQIPKQFLDNFSKLLVRKLLQKLSKFNSVYHENTRHKSIHCIHSSRWLLWILFVFSLHRLLFLNQPSNNNLKQDLKFTSNITVWLNTVDADENNTNVNVIKSNRERNRYRTTCIDLHKPIRQCRWQAASSSDDMQWGFITLLFAEDIQIIRCCWFARWFILMTLWSIQ